MLPSNLRVAFRSLLRSPAFTITVILTLALAIGANSAVFSAIDAVLLKPLPFPEADRLMQIQQRQQRSNETFVAPVRLMDWARMNTTFQVITGYYTQDGTETSGDLPERVKQAYVAPRFLEAWGVAPALGRDFAPDEHRYREGATLPAIITDRYWRKRFNADPRILEKRLRFGSGQSSPIIAVMPPSFLFPDREVDVWFAVGMDAPFAQSRFNTWFNAVGRLKPGVTLEQARANMAAVQATLARDYGRPDTEITPAITPLKETTIGNVRQSLWLLFGGVSLLLVIACTNVAALLLARASQRKQEVAVRYSLGATRGAIIAQLMSEAFVLSLTGALVGLGLAFAASRVFRSLAANLPRIDEIALDPRILLYTLVCAIAATFLCGIVPALRGSRRDTRADMTHASRTQVSSRNAIQWTLVGVQVALAVTLLAGAGLLLRSFQKLGQVSPGFETSNVLTMRVTSSWAESDMRQRGKRTVEFLATIPGVEAASTTFGFPGTPNEFATEFTLQEGRADSDPKIIAQNRFVAPGYFNVMRIPLVAGEMCRDEVNPAFVSVLVNRSFANAYFAGTDPIGRHLRFPNTQAPPARILGIVADAREAGINKPPSPVVYGCGAVAQPNSVFLLRTRTDPSGMTETIRRKMREYEPNRSVFDIAPLEQRLDEAFSQNRLRTVLLTSFAVTAVSLACVGLYGTLSYFVSQRRREVGLRLALGALRSRIVHQFVSRGLIVVALGCLAGLGLSIAFTRLISEMLFGVSPWDPVTLSAVIALMLAVAALAALIPSIRAARVEPMQVLRDE